MSIKTAPVQVWFDVLQDNSKEPLARTKHYTKKELDLVYRTLLNEFIHYFGLTPAMQKRIRVLKKAKKLLEAYLDTADRSKILRYKAALSELQDVQKEVKFESHKLLSSVSKFMGHPISTNKMTIFEFYGNLKLLEEWQRKESTRRT